MKKHIRKLRLNRETLRHLERSSLARAAGGETAICPDTGHGGECWSQPGETGCGGGTFPTVEQWCVTGSPTFCNCGPTNSTI